MPDIPDIQRIRTELTSRWSERNALIDEMDALRFMDDVPDVPTGMEPDRVVMPTAYQMVERMLGTLLCDDPRIEVPPRDKTQQAERQASTLERWTQAAIVQLERQADEDVRERFLECLIAYGHAAARIMYAPQLWELPKRAKGESDKDYTKRVDEAKRGQSLPISMTWLDPRTVYPMWSELGLEAILEVDQRELVTLRPERFNLLEQHPEIWEMVRERYGDAGTVEFTQLWTRDSLTYAIGDEVVHHETHTYGRPPYVYAMGATVSTRDAGRMGLSMLYPLRHLLPYLNRLMTQKATSIRLNAWPTPVLEYDGGEGLALTGAGDEGVGGEPIAIDLEPGKLVSVPIGYRLRYLTLDMADEGLNQMISVIQSAIERAGISDVLYGQSSSGDSGYLVNQLIAAARTKFKPIQEHMERAIEQMIQRLWDIVEYQVEDTLYVYGGEGGGRGWLGLGPDDLRGYRNVNVTLNPVLPTDTYARSSQTINEVQARLRSRRSGMERIGVEQPDEERDQILVEEFMDHPQVRAVMAQEMARRAGVQIEQQTRPEPQPTEMLAALQDPTMPEALKQAIIMRLQGGGGAGGLAGAGGLNPPPLGIQAAPGVSAMPHVGKTTRPSGIATGRAPGRKMMGMERGG